MLDVVVKHFVESLIYYFNFFSPENRPSSNTTKKIVAAASVGVAATAAGVLGAPLIAGAALGAAGFTSAGVAAGSIAAGVQSAIYGGSVAAGSLFALCQSAGATGVIGSAATAVIGGGTGLAGIAGTLGSFKLFVRHSYIFLITSGDFTNCHVGLKIIFRHFSLKRNVKKNSLRSVCALNCLRLIASIANVKMTIFVTKYL